MWSRQTCTSTKCFPNLCQLKSSSFMRHNYFFWYKLFSLLTQVFWSANMWLLRNCISHLLKESCNLNFAPVTWYCSLSCFSGKYWRCFFNACIQRKIEIETKLKSLWFISFSKQRFDVFLNSIDELFICIPYTLCNGYDQINGVRFLIGKSL